MPEYQQYMLFQDENKPPPLQSILPGVDLQEDEKQQQLLFDKAYAALKDWIKEKHGTAAELVFDFTSFFSPLIQMHLIELINKTKKDESLIKIEKDYIETTLTLEDIETAIQGKKKKPIQDNTLDELFINMAEARRSQKFIGILNFVSKFREYAPFNNMLIYLQRPTAKYWATERLWRARFKRKIKDDAIPIVILQPMGPVMLVYEIEDTDGPELPKGLLNPFEVEGKFDPDDLERLINECSKDGINVKGATLRGFLAGRATHAKKEGTPKFSIELNKIHKSNEQFATLCHEMAHIYLGHLGGDPDGKWPSRIALTRKQRELEAEAVAYIVCRRRNLVTLSADYLAGYWADPVKKENVSVDMIMKVAGRIEQKLPRTNLLYEE